MSHPQHDIFESRRQFQLERLILFSDAVFAIAITLLILEIKLPHIEGAMTQQEMIKSLKEITPDFLGFLLSFAVIGQFWSNHHRLFGYISDYNSGLLWLNLHVLLWVAVMPFTTHLNMQYGGLDIVWFIYSLNLALISFALLLIWRYIGKHRQLSYMSQDRRFMKFAFVRSTVVTIIFFTGGALTLLPWLWIKWASRFFFFLIFPAMSFITKRLNAKQK
jgi:uncharacterized membrane protein